MSFDSPPYLYFIFITVVVYFLLPSKFKPWLLLIASYYYYVCWKPISIIVLLAYTIINFTCGILISQSKSESRKKLFLVLSLVSNIGMLLLFKYFNFFDESLRFLFNHLNIFYGFPHLTVLAPIGISFFTFKTISYILDVYKGVIAPEKDFKYFALYTAFFPQIIAGPIDKARDLIPQFKMAIGFDAQRIAEGLLLILWGIFKKVVIADRLAFLVNTVFGDLSQYSGLNLIIAIYCYALQIYCDFSGYSDMAVGTAKILGFNTTTNFKQPFYSDSVSEFWRRWHISLSSWFKEYIFIPLGFLTKGWGLISVVFSGVITFTLCGFWHGANWTFIIFGFIHGLGISFDLFFRKIRKSIKNILPSFVFKFVTVFITLNFVCFTFIFFRASSLSDAIYIIKHLFVSNGSSQTALEMGLSYSDIYVLLFSFVILELVHILQLKKPDAIEIFRKWPFWIKCGVYLLLLFIAIFWGVDSNNQFIYVQF